MKKIFKMANAELSKIFMRPSMFVLFSVLVVALVLSFMFFKPTSTSTKFEYADSFTSRIYTNFQNDYVNIEHKLIDSKIEIYNYLDENNNVCDTFKKTFRDLEKEFKETVYNAILSCRETHHEGDEKLYPTDEDLELLVGVFADFKTNTRSVRLFMLNNIKDKYTNLFITNADYEQIYHALDGIFDIIPSGEQLRSFSTNQIMERYNLIKESFNLEVLTSKVNALEKIEVNPVKLQELLNKYYYTNIIETNDGEIQYTHNGRLKELYDDVITYYNQVNELYGNSSDSTIIKKLNEKVSNFYDYVGICTSLLSNNFEVLRIGNKSDDEIATYNGFSGVSTYALKNEIVTYEYLYNNNAFAYEYLRGFNFNTNSGIETNAYDFSFYAMQILSFLITLFVIFFACGSISGEQTAGTLKMVAIRPFTRNKIYSGKFLACLNVAMLLLLISFAASFVIGIAMYGIPTMPMLITINATHVFVTSPLVLMLIYFISLLVDFIFYISLALIISMIIKQTVISTAITSAVLITSTVIAGVSESSAIRFIPSLNSGLFKFFTKSQIGIFGYNVVPNITMWSSVLMLTASILMFDIIGRFLFTHRSIDR